MAVSERKQTVTPLDVARSKVWDKLQARAGQAPKSELEYAWDDDPELLDEALRSLRDDGYIAYCNGEWYIRDRG